MIIGPRHAEIISAGRAPRNGIDPVARIVRDRLPETGIILVTCNNLYEATVLCLDTIFRHTGNED